VGVPLLTRPRAGSLDVRPTDAGEALLREARAVLPRLEAALRDGSRVRLGVLLGLGSVVAAVVDSTLELVELADEDELLTRLERGALDLAFTTVSVDAERFRGEPLVHDPLVALVRPDSAPARRGALAEADLVRAPIVRLVHCRTTDAFLEGLGLTPTPLLCSDDVATLAGLVEQRRAVALLPCSRLHGQPKGLVRLTTGSARNLGLVWPTGHELSRAAEQFVADCRKALSTTSNGRAKARTA
jgi:DNA-binding transcriptional LysR family regulator